MIEIISGVKGKGKTKVLIQSANDAMKTANGSIAYLDKSNKHMYELSNKIRMINVKEYELEDSNMFLGFLLGMVSQDHDLDAVYLDSFLTIAHVSEDDTEPILEKLQKISEQFQVKLVLSMSMDSSKIPESMKDSIVAAL
ncbi:MAG: twitching motility protein PilT [Lachnospiraceae bacterium]